MWLFSRKFREKTFIIAVDAASSPTRISATFSLTSPLRSLNIRVVVVYGAAAQTAALAGRQNVRASDLDGAGVTDAPTLQLAIEAANRVTHEIPGGLSANDRGAATTNAVITYPLGIMHGVDHRLPGRSNGVDTTLLDPLLHKGNAG